MTYSQSRQLYFSECILAFYFSKHCIVNSNIYYIPSSIIYRSVWRSSAFSIKLHQGANRFHCTGILLLLFFFPKCTVRFFFLKLFCSVHLNDSILVRGVMFRKNDFERTLHKTNIRKQTHTKTQQYKLITAKNLHSVAAKSERIIASVGLTLEVDFQRS